MGTIIKKLIIYDSQYGNTGQIALSMGQQIGADARMPRFGVVTGQELCTFDLLIIGSPTQQGKALLSITILLDAIPPDGLKDTRVAAFDTRHRWKWVDVWGNAATRIADILKEKGGQLIVPPQGFYVKTTRGPLMRGELDRANEWAKSLLEKQP
jgi:flavodoxin